MAKRTTKSQSAINQRTLPHERAPGYRVIFADGALLRTQKKDLLLTFYHDDAPVRTETAEFVVTEDGAQRVRPLGIFTQDFVRSHEVTIRMDLDDAAGLLVALLTRLTKEAPDLLKARGVELANAEAPE